MKTRNGRLTASDKRRLTLDLAARTGLDPRTALKALERGPGALRSCVARERVVDAARDLGIELPLG